MRRPPVRRRHLRIGRQQMPLRPRPEPEQQLDSGPSCKKVGVSIPRKLPRPVLRLNGPSPSCPAPESPVRESPPDGSQGSVLRRVLRPNFTGIPVASGHIDHRLCSRPWHACRFRSCARTLRWLQTASSRKRNFPPEFRSRHAPAASAPESPDTPSRRSPAHLGNTPHESPASALLSVVDLG